LFVGVIRNLATHRASTPCPKNVRYFWNNYVERWSSLIILGQQHYEETRCRPKWLQFYPPHLNIVAALPC